MVYKRRLQGDSSCCLSEDGAGPEMQQTGEAQTLPGRVQSRSLPRPCGARGTHTAVPAQLKPTVCRLFGVAPPLPCDSWFCNTGDALGEAEPTLSAPWARLEEGQRLAELVGTGEVSTLLT